MAVTSICSTLAAPLKIVLSLHEEPGLTCCSMLADSPVSWSCRTLHVACRALSSALPLHKRVNMRVMAGCKVGETRLESCCLDSQLYLVKDCKAGGVTHSISFLT